MSINNADHIRREVNKLFIELFELKEEQLTPESHLFNDLGLDSLDAIDMAIRFKRDFNVQATNDDFKQIQTLGDIYAMIERYAPSLTKIAT